MTRINALASLLLLTTTACFAEVTTDESTADATSELTKQDAIAVYQEAIQCKSGDQMKAKDGCNTCVCHDGAWACTKKFCAPDLDDDVAECKKGQTKKAGDGCNTCSCVGGNWACTLKLCVDDDAEQGDVCKSGATAPAADGCNACKCYEGTWMCTKNICSPSPKK